jgi:hypothetical protein
MTRAGPGGLVPSHLREATLHLSDAAIAHGFAAVVPEWLNITVGYGRGERI